MLIMKFLSGSRKGEEEVISQLLPDSGMRNPIQIREDDVIMFTLKLDKKYCVKLVLHELEMFATNIKNEGDDWIYEWIPGHGGYFQHRLFLNYYGFAALVIIIESINKQSNFDEEIDTINIKNNNDFRMIELEQIDVLAKTLNAERVDAMIAYLAKQKPNLIASVFRVTRLMAGYSFDEKRVDTYFLDRVEKNIKDIEKSISFILRNPILNIKAGTITTLPHSNSVPDDFTINWLCENPNIIYQTDDPYNSIFELDGKHFNAFKIEEKCIKIKTDCYENQVIYGYIYLLKNSIKNIISGIEKTSLKLNNNTPKGYSSFYHQINKYSKSINKAKLERCNQLEKNLDRLIFSLKKSLPVTQVKLGIPFFTAKSKKNQAYRNVFIKMIEFIRLGKPDWSINDELLSITSIPKLFEYYTLLLIKDYIEHYLREKSLYTQIENSNQSLISYSWNDLKISLAYEPYYYMQPNAFNKINNFINTEAWSLKRLKNRHSSKLNNTEFMKDLRNNSRRSPDIVITLTREDESYQIIFDAKYTNNNKAFVEYLPELTMKYIHGIHQEGIGENKNIALMIINPSSDDIERTRHFHTHEYNIFGLNPAEPALLVSSIELLHEKNHETEINKSINKLLDIAIGKFKSSTSSVNLSIVA